MLSDLWWGHKQREGRLDDLRLQPIGIEDWCLSTAILPKWETGNVN